MKKTVTLNEDQLGLLAMILDNWRDAILDEIEDNEQGKEDLAEVDNLMAVFFT